MIKLICSDCNGVLDHVDHDYSNSGYYNTKESRLGIYNKINKIIFDSQYLIKSWMVNELTYEEINLILSKKLNVEKEYLDKILIQSLKEIKWNWDLINLYQKYRQQGIKAVITTDNMDIFSLIAVPHNNFEKYFDKIFNSADMKLLKPDNNYEFFKIISKEYKINTCEILIIDDNKKTIEDTGKIGYKTYLYNSDTCNNFENWFENNRN